jgi:hypothetical protein
VALHGIKLKLWLTFYNRKSQALVNFFLYIAAAK